MKKLKHFAKYMLGMGPKCPIVPIRLDNPSYGQAEKIFTDIFQDNAWNGRESFSGVGSDLNQTRVIMREIPILLREINAQSLLDIPCGDLNWMHHVDLKGIEYVGGDIVKTLVEANQKKYGRLGFSFQHLNLLDGPLPKVDVILCRDCLVHFSYADIRRAMNTILSSGSEYLLTTHFTETRPPQDISTGEWRAFNLTAEPFNFPQPMRWVNEGCTLDHNKFADKCLSLWKIADIAPAIRRFVQSEAACPV